MPRSPEQMRGSVESIHIHMQHAAYFRVFSQAAIGLTRSDFYRAHLLGCRHNKCAGMVSARLPVCPSHKLLWSVSSSPLAFDPIIHKLGEMSCRFVVFRKGVG